MKARKYLLHGCHAYMAHVMDTSFEKKSAKDIPIVDEFLDVFPEDLPGFPPERQVKFRIDLLPGATPMAKTPYHLKVDPVKIKAVMNWKATKNVGEIRSFPGLVGYYRRFIQYFSKIASLLTNLTKKNTPFVWGEEQEEAFVTLRKKLCEALILVLPEGTEDMVIYNDASYSGLGCVLMKRIKVITYSSIELKKHEGNYLTHDIEFAKVVFALKIWRHYLYDVKFIIYTDHRTLQYFLEKKDLNMRQQRRCRTPVCWEEVGSRELASTYVVLATTEKIETIRERLKATQHRWKSYANNKRRPIEFNVGDFVMLKVSLWKGVLRFKNKGKLSPRLLNSTTFAGWFGRALFHSKCFEPQKYSHIRGPGDVGKEKMKRRLNARIDYAKFLEDTLKEMAKEVQSRTSGEPQDLDEFLGKVRTGGSVANDEILGFAKLFKYCNSLAFLVKTAMCHPLLFKRSSLKLTLTSIYNFSTECCMYKVVEYVKGGLTELEHWCSRATKEEQGHMDVMCIWAENVLNKCFSIIERSGDVVINSEGKPPFILAKRDFDNAYKDLDTLRMITKHKEEHGHVDVMHIWAKKVLNRCFSIIERSGDVVINSEGKSPFILTNRDFDNAYKDLETLSFGMVRHMPVLESPANATVKDVLDRVGEGSYSWSPYGFSVKQELIAKLNHEVVSDPIDKLGIGDVLELTPKIPDKSLIE
ncbi:putative reverse transcriptase domain-containing protein, partial [Tanacetum coccineum]